MKFKTFWIVAAIFITLALITEINEWPLSSTHWSTLSMYARIPIAVAVGIAVVIFEEMIRWFLKQK